MLRSEPYRRIVLDLHPLQERQHQLCGYDWIIDRLSLSDTECPDGPASADSPGFWCSVPVLCPCFTTCSKHSTDKSTTLPEAQFTTEEKHHALGNKYDILRLVKIMS